MSAIIGIILIILGLVDFAVAKIFNRDIYEYIGLHLPVFISYFTPLIAIGIGGSILKYADGEDDIKTNDDEPIASTQNEHPMSEKKISLDITNQEAVKISSTQGVEPFKYLQLALINTFNYKDRSRRSEFWEFAIWIGLIYLILNCIAMKMEGNVLKAYLVVPEKSTFNPRPSSSTRTWSNLR